MKFRLKYNYCHFLCAGLFVLFAFGNTTAQNEKKKTVRSKIEYFKDQNRVARLVATLRVKEDRNAPLENVYVFFYSYGDTSKILLDSTLTNSDGQAILILEEIPANQMSPTGLMVFESHFTENNDYKGVTSEIEVQQANLDLSFFQRDTTKYISVEAREVLSDNSTVAMQEVDILFYIKGMFSLLEIGEVETDEEGRAVIEFPVDMPGDTIGLMTIEAKIEDHDLYGNLVSQGDINWGIPVPLPVEKHRGLGDTDAPLWMVYTLIVLLSAVWFHYFYIMFMIIKIKLARTGIPPVQDLLS